MLELFGQSADPALISFLLAWGPLAGDSGASLQVLLPQADQCLAGTPQTHPDHWWLALAKGMAEYRAGRMDQALEWLLKAEALWNRYQASAGEIATFFFLSMTYHRLNRAEEAKAKYQRGLRLMEQYFGGLDQYQPGKGEWYQWLWCQVIRREAEALLGGNEPGKKP